MCQKYTACREGALAGLQCVWHGTAKDRKAIVKSFKTFVTKIATEEYGHLVLLGDHCVSSQGCFPKRTNWC